MDCAFVEGANGGLHTNYEGKAAAAAEALIRQGYDFAYIHVEAPDEMGHQGQIQDKIQAIENVDQRVLRPLVESLREAGEDFRLLLLPDHPTPCELRTHTAEPVPFLIWYPGITPDEVQTFDEVAALQGAYGLMKEDEFINAFMAAG